MLSQNACLKYNEFVQNISSTSTRCWRRECNDCSPSVTSIELSIWVLAWRSDSIFCEKNVGQIDGLDINPFMLALANKKIASHDLSDRVKLVQGDVHSLPYPDACF